MRLVRYGTLPLSAPLRVVCSISCKLYVFILALRPNAGNGLLIHEVL